MIADGKPIIDRSPRCRNVLIAAGHGMLGLSMATGTARLVRELILNQTPHVDPSHYRLHR
jgi:D-amino-acid dehydrogenase